MRYYFRTDVQHITVAATGHQHGYDKKGPLLKGSELVELPSDGRKCLAVECLPCAPYLEASGGARDYNKVPYTHDEELQRQQVAGQTAIMSQAAIQQFAQMFGAAATAGAFGIGVPKAVTP